MSDQEAINLLAGCKTLAQALDQKGLDYPLTEQDLLRLADFKRVWLTNLVTREDIRRASGLTPSQLLWLAHLLSAQETKNSANCTGWILHLNPPQLSTSCLPVPATNPIRVRMGW